MAAVNTIGNSVTRCPWRDLLVANAFKPTSLKPSSLGLGGTPGMDEVRRRPGEGNQDAPPRKHRERTP